MNKRIVTLIAFYCAVGMVANITASRIVNIFGFATDVGTLLFPLIFVIRDLIHKKTNLEIVKSAIWTCTACNAFLFAAILVTAYLPPDAGAGAQTEFATALLPTARIIVASLVSLAFVELVDAFVYEKASKRFGKGAASAAISNVVSIPLDSFVVIAIAWVGVLPVETMASMFVMNCVVKFVMTFAFMPVVKKRKESAVMEAA